MNILGYKDVLEVVRKQNFMTRFIMTTIGCFIIGIFYNSYVVPNNLVYGGVSGIAILVHNQFGISTTIFINTVSIILLILSFILIGKEKTINGLIGFVMYGIMIALTEPFAKYVHLEFDSFLVSILFNAIMMGLGYGLVYRTGFNTGGSDTLVFICEHYFKMPIAYISNIINCVIIVLGAATFGLVNSIYAIIFLLLSNFISDVTILGMSSNKICFIKTRKTKSIEKFLKEELEIGYTLIDSTNGVDEFNVPIIMCVIPSDRFYDLKRELLFRDNACELISKDCYTVEGGHTNGLIPI